MVLSDVDIPPGLPQGDLVALGQAPQDARDGELPQQRHRPIDASGILPSWGSSALAAHVP
jgi:hypothetical protein